MDNGQYRQRQIKVKIWIFSRKVNTKLIQIKIPDLFPYYYRLIFINRFQIFRTGIF
jgi:hypothetical protein